jgi:membrane-associated protease RseP (regulator of RpoE activity)
MLNHIRRDLAVLSGFVVLGLFLAATQARAQVQDQKKQEPRTVPLPDLEKLLPPGAIDPEQMKQLKKLLEGQQEQMQKMMDDLQKQFQGQFPNFQLPNMGGFGLGNVQQENRLGADLQQPSQALVEQLDLPEKQGIVLKSVKAQSAAAKAGLETSDILLELNGKPVPSKVDDFVKQLNEIKKDMPVDAVVMRKGKRETVKGLKLGEVPPAAAPFGGFGGNLPAMPALPPLQLQRLAPGQGGASMSQSRGPGGAFTTKYQEGDLAITISGKLDNKKADLASIQIRDGDKTNTYKSVDEVPEDLRDDVRALVRSVEQGTNYSRTLKLELAK